MIISRGRPVGPIHSQANSLFLSQHLKHIICSTQSASSSSSSSNPQLTNRFNKNSLPSILTRPSFALDIIEFLQIFHVCVCVCECVCNSFMRFESRTPLRFKLHFKLC